MRIQINHWYLVAHTLHPDNRDYDRKVIVTSLDRKSVFFDQKDGPDMPTIGAFMLSRASFRRLATECTPPTSEVTIPSP
ncbi:hypothetical protein HER14_15490 [Acidithiobacillus thiooxidans]|uniref:hypothetical protein n=1 Tax=Acidithiobacillus thiooxidans TaxID=930 RepID=UPI001C07397C|nr:hypothetical protein [Acidithiobacillus thiooxidans]MBU2752294.1 hypothetical protein [Acidithiobacillus thiooxidans]